MANQTETLINFDRTVAFRNGLFVSNMCTASNLLELISLIRPRKTGLELIRLGSTSDGGYLLPNDLRSIDCNFSPGVADSISFETDLYNKFGIRSHLIDPTININLEVDDSIITYEQYYLDSYSSHNCITLENWIQSTSRLTPYADFILQMDIEGSEYHVLAQLPIETLCRFRILIIEFHEVWAWANESFFRIVKSVLHKLCQYFVPAHLHPNNACGALDIGGVIMPQALELTFIRRDRCTDLSFEYVCLPHKLDYSNDPTKLPLVLPTYWGFP